MSQDTSPFTRRLATNARTVEGLLERLLGQTTEADEIARPANLLAAMRHGVLNGGKRLRPFLVIECADLLGGNRDAALRVGAALECVHCYSLVHDDLPAMDDDDMRRGQPTVHRAFDEATAILAGDSLLTFAFDIIAAPETALSDAQKVELILALGRAAGHGGMAGGQALDLAAEKSPPDEAGIVTLQAMKTGALIRFACEAGAIVAGASKEDRARLRAFGEKIGLAFQLADDLLDLTADADHGQGNRQGRRPWQGHAGRAQRPDLGGRPAGATGRRSRSAACALWSALGHSRRSRPFHRQSQELDP
jgi:farnesyl diphosphate synthase